MRTPSPRARACGAVALLLAAGWAVAFLQASPPAKDAPPVLVVAYRDGKPEIFSVPADGGGAPRNLTNNRSANGYPAWSPDGHRIAFASDRDGSIQVYVMDADGGNVKRLTQGEEICRAPAWSPDGKKIAYCRHTTDGPRVFVMDADGTNPKQVNDGAGWDPNWSPDGKKLLFASSRSGNGFHVCLMDADGSHYVELTTNNNPVGFVYPVWSPDGSKIAWGDTVGDTAAGIGMEVFVAESDGTNAKQITKLGHTNTYPTWSPDGKHLTFFHFENEQSGVYYTTDAEGGALHELLRAAAPIEGGRPAWQPK